MVVFFGQYQTLIIVFNLEKTDLKKIPESRGIRLNLSFLAIQKL